MKPRIKLDQATTEQLVDLYMQLAVAQSELQKSGRIAQFNRISNRMDPITAELERRPGNQRTALIQLYGHPDRHVQFSAARDTWFAANADSRRKLEEIRDSKWQPYCADAAMQIRILDGTACKPPAERDF